MNFRNPLFLAILSLPAVAQAELNCDLTGYRAQEGLKAQMHAGVLDLTWQGERREQLRASFTIRDGQPVVQELAVRKDGGSWITLGANLRPEFQVTSGVRRLSQQQ